MIRFIAIFLTLLLACISPQAQGRLAPTATCDEKAPFATDNGQRTWKIYGPDLDGRYGGLQGIGGLEATLEEAGNLATGILTDVFGNAAGTLHSGTLTWNPNRVGSYGALPGHSGATPRETVSVAQATAWRGKTADATGFYWLGARYYEPNGGRFLSADPAGHAASLSLYDYAQGDPVNFADPDGRIGKAVHGALGHPSSNTISAVTYRAPSYGIVDRGYTSSSSTASSFLSGAFNAIPVLGTVKSYIELSSGNDLFTGAQISQRAATFNVLASAIPFAVSSIAKYSSQALMAPTFSTASAGSTNYLRPTGGVVGGAADDLISDSRFWSKAEFNGTKVYQRNDLIDATLVDARGRTNLQRMQSGLAPIGPDGKSMNLHHMTQTNSSPLAELTATFHQQNSKIIHINPSSVPSGIDRKAFDTFRGDYWINRANNFSP